MRQSLINRYAANPYSGKIHNLMAANVVHALKNPIKNVMLDSVWGWNQAFFSVGKVAKKSVRIAKITAIDGF